MFNLVDPVCRSDFSDTPRRSNAIPEPCGPRSKGCAHCRRPPNRGGPTEWAPTEEIPEFRHSLFSDGRQNHVKTNFLIVVLKNPLVESVASDHTQLFTEGFPAIFHEGLFSSWNYIFLVDFICRFRAWSRMFAFGWLAVACAGHQVA